MVTSSGSSGFSTSETGSTCFYEGPKGPMDGTTLAYLLRPASLPSDLPTLMETHKQSFVWVHVCVGVYTCT